MTKSLFDLKNKVSVITGGYSHLGFPISEALAEGGSSVYLVGRTEKKCYNAAAKLRKKGYLAKSMIVDISSMKSATKCFKEIIKKEGRIDVLVNSAAFSIDGNLDAKTESQWIKGIDGTINSIFRTTKSVIPIMKKNGSGSIINIASMYGTVSPDPSIYRKTGYDNPPEYGAGKAAIIQFSKYIAVHYAKYGIRCNTISPGAFPSEQVQKNKRFVAKLKQKSPMNRIGKSHEIKGTAVFLASEASSFVTGQNINVDGGWTIW